jgi:hypothetical protein
VPSHGAVRSALALLVVAGGCRGILGLEELDPPRDAVAASGGHAGGGRGASGGGEAGDGGDTGEEVGGSPDGGGAGGASTSGTGGVAGRATSGSGGLSPAGGSGSGEGGAKSQGGTGGADSEPVFPSLGEPCRTPGRLACVAPASRQRILCDGQEWTSFDECPPDQRWTTRSFSTLC